jgi:hypothetical protein
VPDAGGQGVAAQALRLLAGWAFRVLRLARLELFIEPDNVASQRVAERCGFVRELLRSRSVSKGRRRDSVVFGLLAASSDKGRGYSLLDVPNLGTVTCLRSAPSSLTGQSSTLLLYDDCGTERLARRVLPRSDAPGAQDAVAEQQSMPHALRGPL